MHMLRPQAESRCVVPAAPCLLFALLPMNPRVCICCGETIAEALNTLSRNPNLCGSCSSLADGVDDSAMPLRNRKASTKSRTIFATTEALQNEDGAVVVPYAFLRGV